MAGACTIGATAKSMMVNGNSITDADEVSIDFQMVDAMQEVGARVSLKARASLHGEFVYGTLSIIACPLHIFMLTWGMH